MSTEQTYLNHNDLPRRRTSRARTALLATIALAATVSAAACTSPVGAQLPGLRPSPQCELPNGTYVPACQKTQGRPDGWFVPPPPTAPPATGTSAPTGRFH